MKAQELRQKGSDELQNELLELRQEQFKLRMQASTGQLSQSHLLRRCVAILHV